MEDRSHPDQLELVVGELDRYWRTLEPSDDAWGEFLYAYHFQSRWSAEEHWAFFDTHLNRWPLAKAKRSRSGLVGQRVAIWRRRGYSRKQIASELGYLDAKGAPSITQSVWDLSADYRDWLAQRPMLHPADLFAQYEIEDVYAASFQGRGNVEGAARFRARYRLNERTPRVVTPEERGSSAFARFGHPEELSRTFLDGIDPQRVVERNRLEQIQASLYEKTPKGDAPLVAREPHSSMGQTA